MVLGEDFQLPQGFDWDDLEKEENIFDVWFESGCSWHSVAKKAGWPVPVDLYLEGSDQHRGWFQLSLLPALGAIGKEPYKAVLTHGFTVDEKGMKQSKSLGNYVNAQEETAKYGADILRLWVSSVNYQEDVRCNDELIGRTQDAYKKIRNTLRYLISNINDFTPDMSVPYQQMSEIDKWAMQQLQKLIKNVTDSYENFIFHKVFSLIYNFCTIDMSSIYMDVLKDRLYCDAADSHSRRSSQTIMLKILDRLIRMLAPILAHTAEEVWSQLKFKSSDTESIHWAEMPKVDDTIDSKNNQTKWNKIMALRDDILRVLENLRQDKKIASNLEAVVTITCGDKELINILKEFSSEQMAALCIVSEVKLLETEGETSITAEKSSCQKCQRCWNYWPSVGANEESPDLCRRCAQVVSRLR
ncbi:MAG: class I tRNA ligase family protein [Planctomycetota bacterium]